MRTIAHRLAAIGATAVVVAGSALAATPAHAAGAAPIAVADFYTASPGETLVLDPSVSPFANDSDPDGDAIMLYSSNLDAWTFPGGRLIAPFSPAQPVTIEIDPSASGALGFSYSVTDGTTASNWASVTIQVGPIEEPAPEPEPQPNTPPVTIDDWFLAEVGTSFALPGSVLLWSATDADGDPISVVWESSPASGMTLAADGAIAWAVPADFCGVLPLQYRPFDGTDVGAVATVELRAAVGGNDRDCESAPPAPVNSAPVASDDSFLVEPGGLFSAPAPGVLIDDSDADGDPIVATALTAPAIGAGFSLGTDGTLEWAAPADFCGSVSFDYAISDGLATSEPATVTLIAYESDDTRSGEIGCSESGEPADPTEPTEPTDPAEPTAPDQPTEPEQPTSPTEPEQTTEPAQPTVPTDPQLPTQPLPELTLVATPRVELAQTGAPERLLGDLGATALLALLLGAATLATSARRRGQHAG